MLANYIHIRLIIPYPPVFIRVGMSIQKHVGSHLHKTRPVTLKKWLCPIFNEQDQIAKSRASIQKADRRKSTASGLNISVLNATPCSKQSGAVTTFVRFRKLDCLSLKRIINVVVRRESSMK